MLGEKDKARQAKAMTAIEIRISATMVSLSLDVVLSHGLWFVFVTRVVMF